MSHFLTHFLSLEDWLVISFLTAGREVELESRVFSRVELDYEQNPVRQGKKDQRFVFSGQHERLRNTKPAPLAKGAELVLPESPTTVSNSAPRAPSAGSERDPEVSNILEVGPTGSLCFLERWVPTQGNSELPLLQHKCKIR